MGKKSKEKKQAQVGVSGPDEETVVSDVPSSEPSTVAANTDSNPDTVQVEILPERFGGLGSSVVEQTHLSKEENEALGEPGHEVAELQARDVPHLNLDLRGEYSRPQKELAIAYRSRHHPKGVDGKPLSFFNMETGAWIRPNCYCKCCFACRSKQKKNVNGERPMEFDQKSTDLIRFGPGISSYFKWLKLLGAMYTVLSLIQLPVMFFNVAAGDYFDNMLLPIVQTTVGNLYRLQSVNATTQQIETQVYSMYFPGICDPACELDTGSLVFYYGAVDAFTVLAFLVFLTITGRFLKIEERKFATSVLKVESYSIMVKGLPKDTRTEEIRHHFEDLLRASVADVQLVQDTGNSISLCVKRGKLIKKVARLDAYRKYLEKKGAPAEQLGKAVENYEKVYQKIVKMDDKTEMRIKDGSAMFAFVTFETQRDRVRCLKIYKRLLFQFQQTKELRLRGKHPLSVKGAPPPSTLLWENNEVTKWSRGLRRMVSLGIIMVLLIATAAVNYVSEPYKLSKNIVDTFASTGNSVDTICDGQFSGNLTLDDALLVVAARPEYEISNSPGLSLLNCLCENELNPTGFSFPNQGTTTSSELFETDGVCASYLADKNKGYGIQAAVSFATLLLNTLMFFVLTGTGFYMKYGSILSREMAILQRLFVATYLNTAIVVLIVNADLAALVGTTFSSAADEYFGSGTFVDFSQEWYRVVGTEIILITFLNVFAPHIYPLFLATVNTMYRVFHKPISQSELNEMYLGPDFVLSYRISQVTMMCFLIMTYSTGIPILYAAGAVSAFLTYWVDKYFFTKVTRTPAQFSTKLGMWANSVLHYAAVIHLLFGIWMLSSPFMFPLDPSQNRLGLLETFSNSVGVAPEDLELIDSNSTTGLTEFGLAVQDRFTRDASIPNLLLLLLLVLYRLLSNFAVFVKLFDRVARVLYKVFAYCFSGVNLEASANPYQDERQMTFQQATDLGAFRGITSYNILANPRYADAFNLSEDVGGEKSLLDVLKKRATDAASTTLSSAFSMSGMSSGSS